jgi:hypothetical protein
VVAGIHVPGVLTFPPANQPLSEEGRAFLARQERWRGAEGGYAHEQATYPQSLAVGLNDSPAGLAAWIVDKFRAWSDCDGVVERRFTKDELLANITIYWVTSSINSSFLFYYESQHNSERRSPMRVEVPVGVALFPKENPITGPRDWAEAAYNIVRWTECHAAVTSRLRRSLSCWRLSCGSSFDHSGKARRGCYASTLSG